MLAAACECLFGVNILAISCQTPAFKIIHQFAEMALAEGLAIEEELGLRSERFAIDRASASLVSNKTCMCASASVRQ